MSSSVSIKPFPQLAVEIIGEILSQCETSTLATVCAASYGLLSLAVPLLYRDVAVSTRALVFLFCDRPPGRDNARLRAFLSLDQIKTLTIRGAMSQVPFRLDTYYREPSFDRLLDRSGPFPPLLRASPPRYTGSDYTISFRGLSSLNPSLFEFDGLPYGLEHYELRSLPIVRLDLPPNGWPNLKRVDVKNAVVIFPIKKLGAQEGLALYLPSSADVVIDLRAYTVADRGRLERGWRCLGKEMEIPFSAFPPIRVVPSFVKIEMGNEKEKAAMERMFVKLGWTAREKAIVVRAPDP